MTTPLILQELRSVDDLSPGDRQLLTTLLKCHGQCLHILRHRCQWARLHGVSSGVLALRRET